MSKTRESISKELKIKTEIHSIDAFFFRVSNHLLTAQHARRRQSTAQLCQMRENLVLEGSNCLIYYSWEVSCPLRKLDDRGGNARAAAGVEIIN